MLLGSVLNVSAAGLRDIFDAKYYADSYSDLKETFGYDENQLYNHFITYGLKEGRNMSPILDVVAYREAYGDLNTAFGDNWDAYVNHFLNYGASEMRDKGVLFNPVVYADAYGDIKTAYGSDLMAIARHYLTLGKAENRTLGTSNGYADMATAKAAEWAAEQVAQRAERPGKPSVTWDSWGGRTEYEYDSLGNCIAEIFYDSAGNRTSYIESAYDGKKKQKLTRYNCDGNVTSYSTYEWDGNKVKISHYDATGNPDGYTECETDSHFNFTRGLSYDREGKLINSYVQTFDGDDNVLTTAYYDADGNEYSNTTCTYYENGVIKTEIYIATFIEGRSKYVNEYNENGSRVSSRAYSDEKLEYEATYEYSAEGPLTKACEVSYWDNGSIDDKSVIEYASDGSRTSSWEHYDSAGVLISKRSDAYNAQNKQVRTIAYNISDGKVSSVHVIEYENGRTVKVSSYEADGETLTDIGNYTYLETDYGYDQISEHVSADGGSRHTQICMVDKDYRVLGYRISQPDGGIVEEWIARNETLYYTADGKLYMKAITECSGAITAVYEYEADGTVIALVKDENGNWVRPSENPSTDEPSGSVSGGDAASSVSGNDVAGN